MNESILPEVILPVKYPLIKTYPLFTNTLSILGSREEACRTWLLNNYILLWIGSESYDDHYWADFKFWTEDKFCPFIKDESIPKTIVNQKYESIIDFVIESLNKEYYLFFNTNMYYIPEFWDGEPQHRNHEMFVFGYNKEKKLVYIANFFKREYKFIQTSFTNLQQAYDNFHLVPIDFYYLDIIWLKKFQNVDYQLDIDLIRNVIKDFLASTDTTIFSSWFDKKDDKMFGMQYFTVLQNYLEYKINNGGFIDVRPFHLLYELNFIMLLRINYLKEKGYIKNHEEIYSMFLKNQEIADNLRNSFIKYNISKNKQILERHRTKLDLLTENERSALEFFIKTIELG
jgi:hypothetical protein